MANGNSTDIRENNIETENSDSSVMLQEISTETKEMLENLSVSNAHFKHQQRGESELTANDKYNMCKKLYLENKLLFLGKFYHYLRFEDIVCFRGDDTNYEVKFYLQQIQKLSDNKEKDVQRKNRRYYAMKHMKSGNEGCNYFSDDEMEKRDPLLYEQMVGQFLSGEEREDKMRRRQKLEDSDAKCGRISSIFLHHMENERVKELKEIQLVTENLDKISEPTDNGKSENESDEESEIDDEDEDKQPKTVSYYEYKTAECEITDEEKMRLTEEFRDIMEARFLDGKDEEFDYAEVDDNEDFDDLKQLEQDNQDKYFDADDDDNEKVEVCGEASSDSDDYMKFDVSKITNNESAPTEIINKTPQNKQMEIT